MNLRARHVPRILLGGAVGAAIGWLLGSAIGSGVFPKDMEEPIGLPGIGLMFGSIVGLAVSVIAIVVKAARDPNAEVVRNFTQLNGSGSILIGRSDRADDGSYWTTEWFTLAWIPIFPVCRYRVIKHSEKSSVILGQSHTEYSILEKASPRGSDVVKVYSVTMVVLMVISLMAFFMIR